MNPTFRPTLGVPAFVEAIRPDAGRVYAVYSSSVTSIPSGWVTKTPEGRWLAWNQHGDFWHGSAPSRDLAALGMYDAPTRHFTRNELARQLAEDRELGYAA